MSPLRLPPHPTLLASEFPNYILLPSKPLYRIHKTVYAPWWFSFGTHYRFDLPDPLGTCYLAAADVGAFIEVFQDWIGTGGPIALSEISTRRISMLAVPEPVHLADCSAPHALSFGVTGETHKHQSPADSGVGHCLRSSRFRRHPVLRPS